MNTTSRLEQMARALNPSLLVSADAWRHLLDTDERTVEDLGTHVLRGRASPLQVYAVATSRPTASLV
jgi:class 3 adenylate cyclase